MFVSCEPYTTADRTPSNLYNLPVDISSNTSSNRGLKTEVTPLGTTRHKSSSNTILYPVGSHMSRDVIISPLKTPPAMSRASLGCINRSFIVVWFIRFSDKKLLGSEYPRDSHIIRWVKLVSLGSPPRTASRLVTSSDTACDVMSGATIRGTIPEHGKDANMYVLVFVL